MEQKMPELDWIRGALADRRLSVVAQRTGLSEPTLRAIRDGNGNPTIKTINKLATYLIGQGE
jgi:DNA-binding phage protein